MLKVNEPVSWALGFLVAGLWVVTNFILMVKLLKIAALQKSRRNLYIILILKFPVLYLLGFAILISKIFPISSLLAGLAVGLIITGIVRLWPKRAQ